MTPIIPSTQILPISFEWAIEYFDRRGKEQFGPLFRIHPIDHELIYKLLVYFLQHEGEATRLGIFLNKGVLLTGPVGCGKTQLITLMRTVPPVERTYAVKPCRDVSFEFGATGFPVIDRYSKLSFRDNNVPRTYCFDDLGPEHSIKYYGNDCNVMGEVILSRYDYFISCGMITHITTNLTPDDMESFYGSRVRSRLREMLNLISFSQFSKDKRQ